MKDVDDETERELRAALAAIQQGRTPPPMRDPYTGQPMNRSQRRQMAKKVAARLRTKEKEA